MAASIIIYFGLRAGFSLLKLHPLEPGSCLNSCNRNELRFPGKGNANLPVKCLFTRVCQLQGTLSVDRDKALVWDALPGIRHWMCPTPQPGPGKGLKMLWKLKELSCSPMTGTRVPFPAVTSCFCGTKPGAPSVLVGGSSCPALDPTVH